MTSLATRNPQAAAAASPNSFQRYIVFVTGIDATKAGLKNNDPRGLAQTVDTFGKHRQIGVSSVVGSGTYPQVGETWVVDQSLGTWTFLSKQVAITPSVVDFMTLAQALDQLGLIEYTGPVKPPPVTTGTTVQSFVDAVGDVWVAKAGVHNGAWKKARDVLHSRVYHSATWNITGTNAPVAWTNIWFDDYGFWPSVNSTNLVIPVAGMYMYNYLITATYGANNYGYIAELRQNGGRQHYAVAGPSIVGWATAGGSGALKCAAGDVFTVTAAASGATITGGNGNDLTHVELHYMGTG